MGQIVKTKKKGRPSKADLEARRAAAEAAAETADEEQRQRDIRRSLRRRGNVRYNIIDYEEDYIDDEDEFNDVEDDEGEEDGDDEDEDGERRREKKLKFVLKLPGTDNHHNHYNHHHQNHHTQRRRGRGRPRRDSGGGHLAAQNRPVGGRRRPVDSDDDVDERAEELDEVVEENRTVKKRKIRGGDVDDGNNFDENEDNKDKGRRKEEPKRGEDSASGTPRTPDNALLNTPMPEKLQLELMLDKLQKKDTYGVYSEPVDPEELPDYHEIIDNPMDFATVRKKLADGAYSILEDFESDIFLICSNAMEYNAPDTVYHKQARSIKELAERKFQRVRLHIDRSLKESKTEEKIPKVEEKLRLSPLVKKQIKKPISRGFQHPLGSDFSSGATLATDVNNVAQLGHSERPSNNNGHVEGIPSQVDNNVEKVEDLSGKGIHMRFGRKTFVVDENRRATYEILNQPVDQPDSIFTTFQSEQKQLIPVGVVGEHSYARSLARFSAAFGPAAWSIASKRIEQALPPGFKYGRGWVGEYEPVTTSILVLGSSVPKDQPILTKIQTVNGSSKSSNLTKNPHSCGEQMVNRHATGGLFSSGISKPPTPTGSNRPESDGKSSLFGSGRSTPHTPSSDNEPRSDGKSSLFGSGRSKPPAPSSNNGTRSSGNLSSLFGSGGNRPLTPTRDNGSRSDGNLSSLFGSGRGKVPTSNNDNGRRSEGKPSSFISGGSRSSTPTNAVAQQHNPFSRNTSRAEIVKEEVPCFPSTSNLDTNFVNQNQIPSRPETDSSRPLDTGMRNANFLQSLPFKEPDMNGAFPVGFPNGGFKNHSVDINRMIGSPPNVVSSQVVGSTCISQKPDQALSDPVQVMRMLAEKSQKQKNGSNLSFGPPPVRPPIPSPIRPSAALPRAVPSPKANTGNAAAAAAAAASVWMPVGAGGSKPASENFSNNRSQISAASLYSASRDFQPPIIQPHGGFPTSMHFQSEKSIIPFQAFVHQPDKVSNEAPAPSRPLFFPQPVSINSPRFQAQSSPWRGLSPHTQHGQKQDTLPPDLNIAFQSSCESQQPDLALQL